MSKRTNTEFEISEQTLGSGLRRILLIEYEVTKKEINRYYVELKEGDSLI